jgi:hypothetical protein
MESLILAQNERWRRVLSMQVERDPDHSLMGAGPTGQKRKTTGKVNWQP